MRGCLDEGEALAYHADTLSTATKRELEAHVGVCSACMEFLLALTSGRGESAVPTAARASRAAPEKIANYTILEEVGSGAMGVIYAAYDLSLERRVALKVVRRVDEASSIRILREAKAMARLNHPNVITIYGVHTLPGVEVAIAMEYMPGKNLRQWLSERPRMDWSSIRKVLLQAAAGLAAAHDAGLVHRDFKPDNLMLSDDGQTKVIDFGLVRSIGDSAVPSSNELPSSPSPFDTHTEDGACVGTPAYMAPEQLKDGTTDSRTDQFSFCVTLFEAIYGQRPFAGKSYRELRKNVAEGRLELPELPRGVPRAVKALLKRGLSIDPDQRFASMRDLITVLENATAERPWYRTVGFSAAAAGVVILSALFVSLEAPCPAPSDSFDGVWSAATKTSIQEAFRATGLEYAEDTWSIVMPRLDAFVSSWQNMHVESCLATRVRHEQPEHIHSLRTACLQQKKERFRAATQLLRTATQDVVERAPDLVSGLSLRHCRDGAALRAVAPLETSTAADTVASVRQTLGRIRAQFDLGAWNEGLTASRGAVEAADASGHPPVKAEAQLLRGRYLLQAERYAESAEAFQRAYTIAMEANHLDAAADASCELMWVVGHFLAKPELALQWSVTAQSLARLRDADGPREARWLARRGKLEAFMGNAKKAQTYLRAAEAIFRRHYDETHPELGNVTMDLGTSLVAESRFQEALVYYRRAVELRSATYGPRHFRMVGAHQNVGAVLLNLESWKEAEHSFEIAQDILAQSKRGKTLQMGGLFFNLGDLARRYGNLSLAKERYLRSLAVWSESLGDDHFNLSFPLRGLGEVDLAQGDVTAAIEHLERAVEISKSEASDLRYHASAEFALARALHEANNRKRAEEVARSAMVHYRQRRLTREEEEVGKWLVKHGYSTEP